MNILIVYAHHEPNSFNSALFTTAIDTLRAAGHTVQTSDLYAMQFNPVSDRSNFTSVKNADYLKQQEEEMYATEVNGFAAGIAAEQEKLEWCNLMIWQFPLWWFSVPAILKGWVDRVFAMGRVYGQGRFYENGAFRGKKALLSLTTGGAEISYLPDGLSGDRHGDINGILRPIHKGILQFTGFSVLRPHIVYGPARMNAAQREQTLARWKERLNGIAHEPLFEVGQYV